MRKLIAASLALAAPFAFAAADTTAVDGAKTDMLAYVAAMLGLAVAVWGGRKVIGMFNNR